MATVCMREQIDCAEYEYMPTVRQLLCDKQSSMQKLYLYNMRACVLRKHE